MRLICFLPFVPAVIQSTPHFNNAELPPPKKLKKDPTVNTSFLPDREREEEERREREKLQAEWLEQQEKIKRKNYHYVQITRKVCLYGKSTVEERILITYSYWDGTGHRKSVEVADA